MPDTIEGKFRVVDQREKKREPIIASWKGLLLFLAFLIFRALTHFVAHPTGSATAASAEGRQGESQAGQASSQAPER